MIFVEVRVNPNISVGKDVAGGEKVIFRLYIMYLCTSRVLPFLPLLPLLTFAYLLSISTYLTFRALGAYREIYWNSDLVLGTQQCSAVVCITFLCRHLPLILAERKVAELKKVAKKR